MNFTIDLENHALNRCDMAFATFLTIYEVNHFTKYANEQLKGFKIDGIRFS